jgi:hypothetical protein
MRLQTTYSKQLGAFNTIIEHNTPFTTLWNLYLESLVDLCDVHHLSPFAVLGMLETTMEQHPFEVDDTPVTLRMNLTDKAARFVEDNPKNLTMALMSFTLRSGETSLTKLAYLCQRATNMELGVIQTPTAPVQSIAEPVKQPTQPPVKTEKKKLDLRAALTPKPAEKPKPEPKPESVSEKSVPEKSTPERVPEQQPKHPAPTPLEERVNRLKHLADSAEESLTSQIVETNPLLHDFL